MSGSSVRASSTASIAVARLAADLVAGLLEHRPQVEADDRLVLGDEHPQLGTLSAQTAQQTRHTFPITLKPGGGKGWPRRRTCHGGNATSTRRPPFESISRLPPSSSRTSARTIDSPVPSLASAPIPRAVVDDREHHVAVPLLELDPDVGPAVLERVLQQLREDECERRRLAAAHRHRLGTTPRSASPARAPARASPAAVRAARRGRRRRRAARSAPRGRPRSRARG